MEEEEQGDRGEEEAVEEALLGRRGLEGGSGERDGEVDDEKGEKADWEGSTEQRKAAEADMGTWMAGRVALPRPLALGTLETVAAVGTAATVGTEGVKVKEERLVGRLRGEEVEYDAAEEKGGAPAELEMGELGLEEDGEDLMVPLAWFWF